MASISNRTLLGIALLSGLTAILVVMKTPVVERVPVLEATSTLTSADIIEVGGNVREVSVSVGDYAASNMRFIPGWPI